MKHLGTSVTDEQIADRLEKGVAALSGGDTVDIRKVDLHIQIGVSIRSDEKARRIIGTASNHAIYNMTWSDGLIGWEMGVTQAAVKLFREVCGIVGPITSYYEGD